MVMFLPVQQELDCINGEGCILGKIKFDGLSDGFVFCPDNDAIELSSDEQASITQKLSDLQSGGSAIPMQDDD